MIAVHGIKTAVILIINNFFHTIMLFRESEKYSLKLQVCESCDLYIEIRSYSYLVSHLTCKIEQILFMRIVYQFMSSVYSYSDNFMLQMW